MENLSQALRRPGGPKGCPAVFVVRNEKFLVGLRLYSRSGRGADLWTTPGGACEPGETLEETLRRETQEETGIDDLTVESYLGDVPGNNPEINVSVFVCRTNQEPRLTEPEKFREWRWADLAAAPQPFVNPAALRLVLTHFGK